jgi:nitrous oxidase accessory protein NosD
MRIASRRLQHHRAASIALVAIASLGVVGQTAPAAASDTTVVHPGDSIQAAIDASPPGGSVVVEAGVYDEQLVVTKDRISLVGRGAVLQPPPTASSNTCSGLAGPDATGADTQAGICVTGSGVALGPFTNNEHRRFISAERRVSGVRISGFRVEGFNLGVAFVAAADASLERNQLVGDDVYGALTVGSTHTHFSHNVVATRGALLGIGLCVDDVTPATVDHNDVSGYVVGFCVQTQGADIRNNIAHDNCVGVFVDPGIGATVRNNDLRSNNNPPCADFFVTGVGVYLQGTHGTVVRGNRIEGHTPTGVQPAAALIITDEGATASDNTVRNNRFADNTLDVRVDSVGSSNVVAHNRCTSSQPVGLCG